MARRHLAGFDWDHAQVKSTCNHRKLCLFLALENRQSLCQGYPCSRHFRFAGLVPFGCLFIEMYFILSAVWSHNKIYYVYGFMFEPRLAGLEAAMAPGASWPWPKQVAHSLTGKELLRVKVF